MSVNSNINLYYEELVESMAKRAIDDIEQNNYEDENDAIWQAIDDGLIYYTDQAYLIAMATCRGYLSWRQEVSWDEIIEMLFDDVLEEINFQRKKEQKEENGRN